MSPAVTWSLNSFPAPHGRDRSRRNDSGGLVRIRGRRCCATCMPHARVRAAFSVDRQRPAQTAAAASPADAPQPVAAPDTQQTTAPTTDASKSQPTAPPAQATVSSDAQSAAQAPPEAPVAPETGAASTPASPPPTPPAGERVNNAKAAAPAGSRWVVREGDTLYKACRVKR